MSEELAIIGVWAIGVVFLLEIILITGMINNGSIN